MLLPIDWLAQFVKVKHSPAQLAEIFVSLGFETEDIKDNTLDLEVTPNRGDCLSILGLAREYAAKTKQKISLPKMQALKPARLPQGLKIVFEKSSICPRYTAAIIRNVTIKPSSLAIQNRLKQMKIKPINNIVDITNFVMFELGQPLHAFDFDKIKGAKMTIRESRMGESLVTLDQKVHQLPESAIVIEDQDKLIDLSGIMGAENSQISEKTVNILLQAAVFDSKAIRRAVKLLNHATEASYRFERGVDIKNTLPSLARAGYLIKREAEGRIAETFDINNQPFRAKKIKLDLSRIKKLIGISISRDKALGRLKRLGIKRQNGYFIPPSWRHDLLWNEDLIEEIIRLRGYDKLRKKIIKKRVFPQHQKYAQAYNQKLRLKKYLVSQGLTEIQSYSFISEKEAQSLGLSAGKMLAPTNPISADYKYLRPSLLPGLLKTMSLNRWCPPDELNIFEIGTIFNPEEKVILTLASYQSENLEKIKIKSQIQTISTNHPLAQLYKIKNPVYYLEIPMTEISDIPETKMKISSPSQVKPISNVTPACRDFAWVVDKSVNPEDLNKTIYGVDPRVIISVLFDEFVSEKIGRGKKSLAYHIVLDHPQKSLTASEIKQISDKIIKRVGKKHNARLRK